MKHKFNPTIDHCRGCLVIHFSEVENIDHIGEGLNAVSNAYKRALAKAKAFRGKKFHNQWYGGGIEFPSKSNIEEFIKSLNS